MTNVSDDNDNLKTDLLNVCALAPVAGPAPGVCCVGRHLSGHLRRCHKPSPRRRRCRATHVNAGPLLGGG